MLGGLLFFREYQYCKTISVPVDIALIGVAIFIIGAGCYVLCFLKPNATEELIEELIAEHQQEWVPARIRASLYESFLGVVDSDSSSDAEQEQATLSGPMFNSLEGAITRTLVRQGTSQASSRVLLRHGTSGKRGSLGRRSQGDCDFSGGAAAAIAGRTSASPKFMSRKRAVAIPSVQLWRLDATVRKLQQKHSKASSGGRASALSADAQMVGMQRLR